jgi:hypothetical protein
MVEGIKMERGASRRSALILLIAFVGLAVPISLYGWKIAYKKYFETAAPSITIKEQIFGVGVEPTKIHLIFKDEQSGLHKVFIRYQQSISTPQKELIKKTFDGEKEDIVELDLDYKKLALSEGRLTIFIKAIDKSLWSNTAEKKIDLAVDFKPPKLSAFTTMHNEREGGSELIFYRATDANLGDTGVVTGTTKFIGAPAHFFSPNLRDSALYATLYALPWNGDSSSAEEPKLFASDAGANTIIKKFPQKIFERKKNKVRVSLSKDFIGKRSLGGFLAPNASLKEGVDAAHVALKNDDAKLRTKLTDTRLDKYFSGALKVPGGAVQTSFGDELTFMPPEGSEPVESAPLLMKGFELRYNPATPAVFAAGDGIVTSSEALPGYGRVLIVDHGLGLTTLYARLEEASVQVGQKISQGMQIGVAGKSGFARIDGPQCYFEVRVHGEPVDPREWIDEAWVYGHITKQGEDAEKAHDIYFGEEE